MPAKRRSAVLLLLVPVVVAVLVTAAWAVDTAGSDEVVGRNVEVAGVELDGMDADEVRAVARDLEADLADDEVVLSTGDDLLETTAGQLGAGVDADALADAALDARGGGAPSLRPLRWLAGLVTTVELEVPLVVDRSRAEAEAARLTEQLEAPTEPSLQHVDGEVRAVPGTDGEAIDPAEVAAELPAVLDGPAPHVVDVALVPRPPTTPAEAVEAVADDANEVIGRPLTVVVEDQETVLDPAEVRTWVALDTATDPPTWTLDPTAAVAALRPRFSALGPPENQPRFDVVDGQPVIVPAAGIVVCCAEDSATRIAEALRTGAEEVHLETTLEPTDDGVAELEALGITVPISSFTTNHACCENRVRNIQRFADIIRGSIIRPGERFSLNEAVGQRTTAKGFLPAGAIQDGVLEPQVGGGVSQFATTFFNAAFFAGLDFIEYQAHSIYFSRYPRGREATISWPKPDLVVENNTPYGILVWPTYTSTSITVTMYSSPHIAVEDLGRTESPRGACTRVTTTRRRTWPDGRTEDDTVFATYRPEEGLDCEGNRTDRAREQEQEQAAAAPAG